MGIITFNGISSKDLDILIELVPDYETPERDYDIIRIPGRSGDIVIDKGSYKNVDKTYYLAMANGKSLPEMSKTIMNWLLGQSGYVRLEDSYEPGYFRYAMYKGPLSIRNILNRAARAQIIFSCKPQRFLLSGENKTAFEYASATGSGGVMTNPTVFQSKPLIIVHGLDGNPITGTVNIGGCLCVIDGAYTPNEQVFIDCEAEEVYGKYDIQIIDEANPVQMSTWNKYHIYEVPDEYGPEYEGYYIYEYDSWVKSANKPAVPLAGKILNLNSYFSVPNGFPIMNPGQVSISFTGLGIHKIEVIPRWWDI